MFRKIATISTYRGTVDGWQVVTTRNTKAEADSFLTLLNRVRPDYLNRITVTTSMHRV